MTDKTIKVMVIDDSTQRAQGWAEGLRKLGVPGLMVDAPDNHAVVQIVKSLNQRRLDARKKRNWRSVVCSVDDVDVLLIDYDLINLGDSAESTTGEVIAYLARLLSSAKVICVVNQLGTNRFDLTMSADLNKRNDLDIASVQMTNPGLWKAANSWKGFRPWHWPTLTSEVDLYAKRVKDVQSHRKLCVFEYLGFDLSGKKPTKMLPKAALSYFQHHEPAEITFTSLLKYSPFVDSKDVKWLASDADQSVRVAAAVIHKWLERWVLARQDILVDTPHLIARKPWLLKNPKDKKAWHKVTDPKAEEILSPALKQYRFEHEHWLSRAAYWGEEINANPKLAFPGDKWKYDAISDFVFREDLSNFGRRIDSLEFDCQLGSSYDLRYVCNPDRTKAIKGWLNPKKVDYSPAIRLAM